MIRMQSILFSVVLVLSLVGVTRAVVLLPEEGAVALPDRDSFDFYAQRANFPGAMQAPEVKFIIVGVDGPVPQLYFQNTKRFVYHYDFVVGALGWSMDLETFNQETYFRDARRNVAGSVIAHDHFSGDNSVGGIYTLEFWPTDPVSFALVALTFARIREAMPFAADWVFYHPAGETQRTLHTQDRALFEASGVEVIQSEDLFGNLTYAAMNPGETYGRLRFVRGTERVTPRDIVVYESLPNTLGHVAGILTAVPQTPLSHVNIKASQNRTPNAYVKDAMNDPNLLAWEDKLVHLVVELNGWVLSPATPNEVEVFIEHLRPQEPQVPVRDLGVRTITALEDIGFGDSTAYGAKAANVAELQRVLPAGHVPDGFAVPFWFYHVFMEENGFYDTVQGFLENEAVQRDPTVRAHVLAALRTRMRAGYVPHWIMENLTRWQHSFPPGTSLRCRSSTNNEDLPGFNGAGLYESYTHYPHEGHLSKSIKQVWAGLWTDRAFEERDFYRIDHFSTAMGVLVHPNYENEQVNGVAVTRNIYDPNWLGYYVNAQVGENLVTNPTAGAVPEEFLVAELLGDEHYEIQYIQFSNQIPRPELLLTCEQIYTLAGWMEQIQGHFCWLYDRFPWDTDFAMEIEFKVTETGVLVVKQARPWGQLASGTVQRIRR